MKIYYQFTNGNMCSDVESIELDSNELITPLELFKRIDKFFSNKIDQYIRKWYPSIEYFSPISKERIENDHIGISRFELDLQINNVTIGYIIDISVEYDKETRSKIERINKSNVLHLTSRDNNHETKISKEKGDKD